MILEALFGGATGIVGSIISEAVGFFKMKQEHANKMEERQFDLTMMKAEAEAAASVAAMELEKAVTQNEWDAFTASHEPMNRWGTKDHWTTPWIDAVRGLTRPALTVATQLLLAIIFFTVASGPLQDDIVASVIYMANTSFFWWFGQRQIAKAGK